MVFEIKTFASDIKRTFNNTDIFEPFSISFWPIKVKSPIIGSIVKDRKRGLGSI